MSGLLSGFDLIKLEESLRGEVDEMFGERKWDNVECDNVYDEIVKNGKMAYGPWAKMMGTGTTPTARSTRRCLDNKRYHDRVVGNKGYAGIRL